MATYEKPNYMNNSQFIPEFNNINFIEPNSATTAEGATIDLNQLDNRYLKKITNDSTSFDITVNNLVANGSLTSNGNATMKSNLDVSQNLTVTGSSILKSTLGVSQNLTVTGSSTLKGNLDVSQNLTVTGSSTLKSNLDVAQNLAVTGSTTLSNNIVLNGSNSYQVDTYINNKSVSPECNAKWVYLQKPSSTDNGSSSFIGKIVSNFNDPSPVAYTTNRNFYILQWELPGNAVATNESQTLSISIDYIMSQNEIIAPEYSFAEMGSVSFQHIKQFNAVDSSPTGYYNATNHQKTNIGYRGQCSFTLYHETTQNATNKYCILFNATGGGSDPRKFYISFPNISIVYQGDVSTSLCLGVLNSFVIQPTRTAPAFISNTPTPNTVRATVYTKAVCRFKQTATQSTGIATKSYLTYSVYNNNKFWTNITPGYYNTGTVAGFGFPVIGLYKNDVYLYFATITGNKYINIGYDWWDATTQAWTLGKVVQTYLTPQITGYYLQTSFYTTCKISGLSNTGTADSLRIYVLTEVSETLTNAYVISSFIDDTTIDILN